MADDVLCGGYNIGDQVRTARLPANRISTCLTEAYLRTGNVIGPRPISAPGDEVASTWGDRVDILYTCLLRKARTESPLAEPFREA